MDEMAIRNVRVFDDGVLGPPTDVFIADGRIVSFGGGSANDASEGGVLLPGLIDTHVHVSSKQQLLAYGRWGVTTALDMGTPDWSMTRALRDEGGVASLLSAGAVACAPRGTAVRKMGYPPSSAVSGPGDAARFVAERVADGVDYIKVVLEDKRLFFQPDPLDETTVTAIVGEAHRAGLLVCVHATSVNSFGIAARSGADVLTHTPVTDQITSALAADLAERVIAVSPTLIMMKKLVERFPLPVKPKSIRYANAIASVVELHAAGVAILAGTDANSDPAAPNTIEHGAGMHEELALLVDAGLSPAEALLTATAAAADTFRLSDRGRIREGLRADLLLVDGDPTRNILDTQNIRGVWVGGREVR
ncbi:amidohydrolase family protein [Gordonia sp. ABSL11-1]|uniref:amidohydrolase family protein n=1 Tax=Gordonia sp. ABSL11-1 TaxID=3053924 RepID=UPI0025734789|nr:amidohydrolase family protein [Gordonia sp. ABSL11-1]MDL9946766.1 amidohydrolase family protein [Gordonia sp. ABSL11-1]